MIRVENEMGKLIFDNRLQTQKQPCGGGGNTPHLDSSRAQTQRSIGRNPHTRYHLPSTPLDLKVYAFFTRLVLRTMSLYPRGRSFMLAMTGGLVSATKRYERNIVCEGCDRLQIQVPRRPKSYAKWPRYCGSCGCPRWRLSRLSFKNRFRAAYCPLRKHAGPYPDDWWRTQVEALEIRGEQYETG